MSTDAQILRSAYLKETDPRAPARWAPHAWEYYAVGATLAEIRRLKADGYVTDYGEASGHKLYLLTPQGRTRGQAEVLESKMAAPDYRTIIGEMGLIVGFDDVKEKLARFISSQATKHFLLQGPPACAKSLILDAIQRAAPEPYSYEAFGSRTSSAGLSQVLFEKSRHIVLLDEDDKMSNDCYAICLGLMEKGQVVETKNNNIRSENLECMIIAACNSSAKMSREFLSRFTMHAYFPNYTRQEFIDVCVGMLKSRDFPIEISIRIGEQVYDRQLGDVRKARSIADLMEDTTVEEVDKAIDFLEKYKLPDELEAQNKKVQNKRFKRQSQAQLPM